jgi:hypothetical protein
MLALLPAPRGASDYRKHSYAPEGSFAGPVGGEVIDLSNITPGRVLKWGGVILAYLLGVLLVISIVLAMFGVYG